MPDMAGPPIPRRVDHTHFEHGRSRPDPYHWMRGLDAEMLSHLRAERRWYDAALTPLAATVAELARETESRAQSGPIDGFTTSGCRYLIERESGRTVLSRRPVSGGQRQVVVDPDDVPVLAGEFPSEFAISPDDARIAFAVDPTGAERYDLHSLEFATGRVTAGPTGIAAGFAWTADATGLVHLRADEANRPCEAWFWRPAGPGDTAVVVRHLLTEPDQRFRLSVKPIPGGKWLVLTATSRTTSEAWLLDAHNPCDPLSVSPRRQGIDYRVEDASGERLLLVTNDGAPEYRVVAATIGDPDPGHWVPVLGPTQDVRYRSVRAVGDRLVVGVRRDGYPQFDLHDRGSGDLVSSFAPPEGGTIRLLPDTRAQAAEVTLVTESDIEPARWWRVELDTGARSQSLHTHTDHSPAAYRTRRLYVPVRDGTAVPVTVVHHRDTDLDGTAPALLYGYGAYETCFEPEYDPSLPGLLDRGVVFVRVHVRGGGELGRAWWTAGSMAAKENTFTDLIDVAERLGGSVIAADRIATRGMSAGGLLQAVAMSRRPDLWCAVVAEVPWVDVLTSMADERVPLVIAEREEWGDPRDPGQYAWMAAYSPCDNLPDRAVRWPPLLVTGAVHDTRVLVHEPAKWVAALRHRNPAWGADCLFRCEVGSGAHDGPQNPADRAHYEAEIAAWLLSRFGL